MSSQTNTKIDSKSLINEEETKTVALAHYSLGKYIYFYKMLNRQSNRRRHIRESTTWDSHFNRRKSSN